MKPSLTRTLVVGAAVLLAMSSVGPAGASTAPPEPGAVPGSDAPVETLATPNRMISADGGLAGKCLELAGGAPGSSYVQMAPCRSYAHQGWTLRDREVRIDGVGTFLVVTLESHDPDAAGRCLTFMGQGVQARMLPCTSNYNNYWLKPSRSDGYFQLESLSRYVEVYLVTRDPADRKCLDVHVDTTRSTNIVHHWTCGPIHSKGNQLFRIQAA